MVVMTTYGTSNFGNESMLMLLYILMPRKISMNKNAHMATFRLTESSLMDMGLPLYIIWYALLDFDAGTVVEEILAFDDELTFF